MDALTSDETESWDFGMLKARFVVNSEREDVKICFRPDPTRPSYYSMILKATYEMLPFGDKLLVSAEFLGGGMNDSLHEPADFSGTGNLITRTDANDALLLEILDGLEDKWKTVKYIEQLYKMGNLSGISSSELERLKRLANQKTPW